MPRKPAITFIFITLVLDVIGFGLIVPILPKLITEFHGGSASSAAFTYGALLAVYSAMQFVFAPLLGSLSDRFGRRPIILLALLGAGLDYFLLAWAPTLMWFFVGRVISGITGASFSAASAYIADVSPPEKRAANFGMIGAAFGLGFIIGPAAGGLLGEFGLRVPFIAAGIITLINAAYGFFILPESLTPENRRRFEIKRCNPITALLDLRKFPSVLGLAWTHFLLNLAHQVYPATWILYTTYRYGWSSKEGGLSLALVGLMAAIVQGGLTRIIAPKIGDVRTAMLGICVTAVAFVLYGLAPAGGYIYLIIVFGSLGGLATPAIQSLVTKPVAADEQGAVQGALASLAGVSAIFGPIIAVVLFALFTGVNVFEGFPGAESVARFIEQHPTPHIPGAAFFFSAILAALASFLAIASLKKVALTASNRGDS
ncbi:MAG: DHA1 family tetracycline resistance protein-like MFS transporter [Verrucomicrobiales bacterium]|jgi:DHA1 family tetracycline resistance protein-like MFS transporter